MPPAIWIGGGWCAVAVVLAWMIGRGVGIADRRRPRPPVKR